MKKLLILGGILLGMLEMRGQSPCTTLGQTPATAFPVCGSSVFAQTSVPPCVNSAVTAPCSSGTGNVYQDLNPYWYKFTCFASGTLGFLIQPNNQNDDYDWQIFDITNHNPSDVYTNSSLFVACNWSGLTGTTGTSASAASLSECGSTNSFNPPIFSKMPSLIVGHNYLLLISHFSGDSQSGYNLSFGHGGTASITDSIPPALKSIRAICDGSRIQVVLNKKMKCASLAADGSDFTVSPAVARVVAASGDNCSAGFDMDTLTLTLDGPLTPGNYTLTIKQGRDTNTLVDNCGVEIPGSSLPFPLVALQPTFLDSIAPPACAPNFLQLVFPKKILCSSIAGDGSDFHVTGPSAVQVTGATGQCDATGETYSILVQLSGPVGTGGNYTLTLASGTDGNTLIDECGLATPLGGPSLSFTLKDTVSASFVDQILYGCRNDTILFTYPTKNGVNYWKWTFDGGDTSNLQDPPMRLYSVFSDSVIVPRNIQLIVSNGFCNDTASVTVTLDNVIIAAFEAPNIMCPKDAAQFKNNSIGTSIRSYTWDFGDGTESHDSLPADHLFPVTGIEKKYGVMLIVGNSLGCFDTAVQQIDVLRSCYIAVPSAFTPNGDGLNDYLYPLNAFKADNLEFRIYNRYGQLVFESKDYTKKWDGTINGHPQPPGAFVWMLQYTDRDSGKKFFLKGTSLLIR